MNQLKNFSFWFDHFITINDNVHEYLVNGSFDAIVAHLHELDLDLSTVTSKCEFDTHMKQAFLSHYRRQFCFHCACVLLSRGNAIDKVMPLLLMAAEAALVGNENSIKNLSGENSSRMAYLAKESSWRVFQSVRVLENIICKGSKNEMIELLEQTLPDGCTARATTYYSTEHLVAECKKVIKDATWKDTVFTDLFDREKSREGSHWMNSNNFGSKLSNSNWKWPEINQPVCEPSNLSHLVYVLVAENINSKFNLQLDESNQLEENHKIELYSFLFVCAIRFQDKISCVDPYGIKYALLPYANMISEICTTEQNEKWKNAVKVNSCYSEKKIIKITIDLYK